MTLTNFSFTLLTEPSMIFTINDGSTSHKADFTFSVNRWYHVGVIFSSPGSLQIRINGQRISVRTNRMSSIGAAKKVTVIIGSWLQLGNYQGPKVLLAEVAIFCKKLSDAHIKNIVMKNFYGTYVKFSAVIPRRRNWQILGDWDSRVFRCNKNIYCTGKQGQILSPVSISCFRLTPKFRAIRDDRQRKFSPPVI